MVATQSHKLLTKALDDYQASLAVNGDKAAFALLYKRWRPRLYRLAWRMTRNAEDAEDVMQDAAMTIAKNIHKLNDPRRFSAWAYTIVRRRSADHIKKAIHHRDIQDRAETASTLQSEDRIEDYLSLRTTLATLPEADRVILMFFYVDGLNGKEIANALGIPLGTVKSRLFTARQKLKQAYTNPKNGDRK